MILIRSRIKCTERLHKDILHIKCSKYSFIYNLDLEWKFQMLKRFLDYIINWYCEKS